MAVEIKFGFRVEITVEVPDEVDGRVVNNLVDIFVYVDMKTAVLCFELEISYCWVELDVEKGVSDCVVYPGRLFSLVGNVFEVFFKTSRLGMAVVA